MKELQKEIASLLKNELSEVVEDSAKLNKFHAMFLLKTMALASSQDFLINSQFKKESLEYEGLVLQKAAELKDKHDGETKSHLVELEKKLKELYDVHGAKTW